MNFDLSEHEEMLKALAERFVLDRYDLDRRRAYQQGVGGFSAENWNLLSEIGLVAAPLPENVGGLDIDGTSLAVLFEALGRGLVVEPLIENVVLAGRLLADVGGASDAAQDWLVSMAQGERRVALAHAEHGGRGGLDWIETAACAFGDGWVLDGGKSCVPCGGGADGFIISARIKGGPSDRDGVGLWLVPADTEGLGLRPWRMVDGSIAVSLDLSNACIPGDCRLSGGLDEIDQAQAVAQLARSAEALGIMERMLAETGEYLRTREQFGAPLASFQALQHRMVAQYAVKEQLRGLLNRAVVAWGSADFRGAVAGTAAFVGSAALTFGHEMIQFHGGMGVTDELAIGHAHKRLMMHSRWPFSPQVAMERYCALTSASGAGAAASNTARDHRHAKTCGVGELGK